MEANDLIDDVLDSSAIGIVIVDGDCKTAWLNQSFQGYFGLRKGALVGKDYRGVVRECLSKALASPRAFTEKVLATYRDNSYPEQFECRLLPTAARKSCWLEHRSQPILRGPYAGGRIEHYTDITARKQNEERSHKLARQVQQAQKMESIGILAGGVAHDFNNILQAISGYTQLLLMEKQFDDPDFEMLSEIETASRKACALTQQLLAFSRHVESSLRPTDLNVVVSKVQQILKRTIPKMIRIEVQPAEQLRSVLADEAQIEQVLMNLGVNAQQAMPDGGSLIFVTENISVDRGSELSGIGLEPGEYVRISVRDSGCGMDSQTAARIFDPFFTTRRVGQGSGLGLSMAYGIVKTHGGRITCASTPGKGSSFSVYLPVGCEEKKHLEDNSAGAEYHSGNGETVLIVDDEGAVLNLGKNILERCGFKTLTALSGESAMELFKASGDQIDLVLLDLNMPGIGGRRCLMELIQMDPRVKVIVASGYQPDSEIKRLLASIDGGFIGKPYQLNDLVQKVHEMLLAK